MDAPGSAGRRALALAILVGAAVSLTLGVYGKTHDPSGRALYTIGSADLAQSKSVLASITMALGLVQVTSAFAMYRGGRPGLAALHRTSGVIAVLVSVPVAMQCLWSLGFGDYSTHVLVHSLAGCIFYGVFVTRMLSLRIGSVPSWAVPVLGGALFTTLVVVWGPSAAWYFAK